MARPTKIITDDDLRKIEMIAGWGMSIPQIAAIMGMSERTFNERRNETRVSSALAAGQAKAQARVGKALFERAVEGDIAAIRWYEMTRAGRSAEQSVKQIVAQTVEQTLEIKPPDWRALIGSHAEDQAPDNG